MSLDYGVLSERGYVRTEPPRRDDWPGAGIKVRVLIFLFAFPVLFLLVFVVAWFLLPYALADALRGLFHAIDMRLSGY